MFTLYNFFLNSLQLLIVIYRTSYLIRYFADDIIVKLNLLIFFKSMTISYLSIPSQVYHIIIIYIVNIKLHMAFNKLYASYIDVLL